MSAQITVITFDINTGEVDMWMLNGDIHEEEQVKERFFEAQPHLLPVE